MTEKAGNLIKDALKEINASPAEANLSAYGASAAIFYLNTMMSSFSSQGINIGYTMVDNTGSDITVDLSAVDPIVKNLAIELQPVFNPSFADVDLFEQAQEGYARLLEISYEVGASGYPTTLPIGSGNYYHTKHDTYYSSDDPIFTENTSNVAPESA